MTRVTMIGVEKNREKNKQMRFCWALKFGLSVQKIKSTGEMIGCCSSKSLLRGPFFLTSHRMVRYVVLHYTRSTHTHIDPPSGLVYMPLSLTYRTNTHLCYRTPLKERTRIISYRYVSVLIILRKYPDAHNMQNS